jgi:predicted nuclease of predicted toxin-antitoxin system
MAQKCPVTAMLTSLPKRRDEVKLDENFGTRTQRIFLAADHDVQAVRDEGLQGSSDQHLYDVCRLEQRCLVTLDLDFADTIRFQPMQEAGIAVIRLPRNPSLPLLEQLVRQFLEMLTKMSISGRLWVVEIGRIRVHRAPEDED